MSMLSLWNVVGKNKPPIKSEALADVEMASGLVTEKLSGAGIKRSRCSMFAPLPNICAVTDIGRVRDHNEDAYYVSPDFSWFAVADGMGGHDAGEVAAAMAIQALAEYITPERITAAAGTGTIGMLLLDAVAAAHERVCEANRGKEGRREMGCTLAVGSIVDGLLTCHVGDVRCYIMREGVLSQLTHDHSTVGMLVQSGTLTPEQARVHPNKNQVLQAIGMPMGISPDVNSASLQSNDRILVCSDGLWESLPHEELQLILSGDGDLCRLVTRVVDRANEAGGNDNITAILCQAAPSSKKNGANGEMVRDPYLHKGPIRDTEGLSTLKGCPDHIL
jgi:PPM family protein phosphatase